MKTHFLLLIWLLALVACQGTKRPSSIETPNNTESIVVQDNNVEEKDTTPSSRTQSKAKDSSNRAVGDSTNIMDSVSAASKSIDSTDGKGKAYLSPHISPTISDIDLKKMYKYLEMSDSQIQAFENAIRDFREKVKYHPNGEMLGSVGNEQERQLKEVLKENQWKEYQAWKKAKGQ